MKAYNNPDLIYIILSYQRPQVLQQCIESLFMGSKIKPNEVHLLDDGSNHQQQLMLYDFCRNNSSEKCRLFLNINSTNQGVGYQFEQVYSIIKTRNPKKVVIVEGDYIWRNEWLEDVYDVFEKCPYCIAIPGSDHADMWKPEKVQGEWVELMKQLCGEDLKAREEMGKQFIIKSSRGPITCMKTSNSCGCMILNWERFQSTIFKHNDLEEKYWELLHAAFYTDKDRARCSDAHMSCAISFLWEEYAFREMVSIYEHSAFVNILPSISRHLCSQGLNGRLDPRIFPEGTDFPSVNSGTFPENWKTWTRQK